MSFEKHMKCQLVASCTVGQALGRDDIFWAVVFMKVVEGSVGEALAEPCLGVLIRLRRALSGTYVLGTKVDIRNPCILQFGHYRVYISFEELVSSAYASISA